MKQIVRWAGILMVLAAMGMAQEAARPRTLYVINTLGRTLSALDLENGTMTQDLVALGQMPSHILAREAELLVLNSSPAELTLFDGLTLTVTGQVALPEGSNPYQMAIHGDRILVTLLMADQVAVVDPVRREVLGLIPVGKAPQGILVTAERAWVANTGGYPDYAGSSLSCIDLRRNEVFAELPLPANPQVVREGPDGRLYVLCSGAWGGNSGAVAVIDPAAAAGPAVVDTLHFGGYPVDLLVRPDGIALLSEWGDLENGFVYQFDIHSGRIGADASRPWRVGRGAMRFYHDARTGETWICAFDQDAVQKIDARSGAVLDTWPTGDGPNDMVILEAVSGAEAAGQAALANFPNPFNQGTFLHFSLTRELPVRLRIYSLAGRLVAEQDAGRLGPGAHTLWWDGIDRLGMPVSSGFYLGVIEVGGVRQICKMTLLR